VNDAQSVSAAARAYASAGYTLVAWDAAYGKRPQSSGWGLQAFPADQVADHHNVGLNHGLSGTASIDVDNLESTKQIFQAIGLDLTALSDSTMTWSGRPDRLKLLFRAPSPSLGVKALSVDGEVVFELRGALPGKQAQDLLPPSLHPDTKKRYELRTRLIPRDELPYMPEQLVEIWRNWEVWQPALLQILGVDETLEVAPTEERIDQGNVSVIDAYNRCTSCGDVLERNGYKRVGARWLRPGSSTKEPGVVLLPNSERVFSHGGDALNDGHAHDTFDCFRILEHGGDFKRAVKAAAELLGLARFTVPLESRNGAGVTRDRTSSLSEATPSRREQILLQMRADLSRGTERLQNVEPPARIVDGYLYACGSNLAAGGATGKTTLKLCEAVQILGGGRLYGFEVIKQRPAIFVVAEDGLSYYDYLLSRVLSDGVACGAISQRHADMAAAGIHFIHWPREHFGPIAQVDRDGSAAPTEAFGALADALRPYDPSMVALDPLSLFTPSEDAGNTTDAVVSSMLHRLAQSLGAHVEAIDHVAKAVHRSGVIDQFSARGSSAKTDNARMARALTRITPSDIPSEMPPALTADIVAEGNALRLDTTKLNYARRPPTVWLHRRGYWMQPVPRVSAEAVAAARLAEERRRTEDDVTALIEVLRAARSRGEYLTRTNVADCGVLAPDGACMPRSRIRAAISRATSIGRIRVVPLPKELRAGQRREYLEPSNP
jgi:RecA-family ATPase